MKKRSFLIFAVLLIMGPCVAAAAEDAEPTVYKSGGYQYILPADGTAEITKYDGKAAELIVPDTLDGYIVTGIGEDAFYHCLKNAVFTVVRDSWAAQWCKENGLNYTYTDSLDWLNE